MSTPLMIFVGVLLVAASVAGWALVANHRRAVLLARATEPSVRPHARRATASVRLAVPFASGRPPRPRPPAVPCPHTTTTWPPWHVAL